jgi:hypothetical protein
MFLYKVRWYLHAQSDLYRDGQAQQRARLDS